MNQSSVLVRLRLLGGQAFAGGARAAGKGLGSMAKEGTAVTRIMGGVNGVLGATAAAVRGVTGAVGAGAAIFGAYGVKASANFEQAMANVQARLLTSKQTMELLNAQALQLGKDTQFSAQQAADAMGEFAAAGFNAQEIMKIMPGTLDLAAASSTDLAESAETAGAIARQFGLRAEDMGHVADVLTVAVNKSAIGMDDLALSMKYVGPVAGRFNQTLEDMGAATAILGNVGIKGETAGTTLRRALVNLVKPSAKTMDMLAGAGITAGEFGKAVNDSKGRMRGFPTILGNLAKQMRGLSDPKRRKLLVQLFGVEALPGMVTLFDKGEGKIRQMSRSLENSGGAAKRTAKIMRSTVKGAWDELTGSIETAAISFSRRFNPMIRRGLLGAGKLVDKVSSNINQFATAVGGTVPRRARPGAGGVNRQAAMDPPELTAAQKAGAKVRAIIGLAVDWVRGVLPKVGEQVAKVGGRILDAFKPAIPFFQNVLLPLLKGIAIGVIGGVVAAFNIAIPIIKILATVLGWIGQKAAPVKGIIQGVGMVIGFIAGGPILNALKGLGKLGLVFRLLAVPIRIVSGAFRVVVGAIGRAISVFVRAHLSVLRFVGTFVSMPARVVRAALNMVGRVIETVSRIVTRMKDLAGKAGGNFIRGLVDTVRNRLTSLTGFFGRVGKAIVDAIGNAIKAAPGAIVSAIGSIIPDKLKGAARKILPGLASGGVVRRGGMALVGERGPELLNLPSRSTVYDADQTRRAMVQPQSGNFVAVLQVDGKEMHRVVFKHERRLIEAT